MNELDLLQALLWQSLLLGALAALMLATRRLRLRLLGATGNFALWLGVPLAALALTVPTWDVQVPTVVVRLRALGASEWDGAWRAVQGAVPWLPMTSGDERPAAWLTALTGLWLLGALCTLLLPFLARRRLKSVLLQQPKGHVLRSPAGTGPALLGLLRPRLCLPLDFEQRFTEQEQRLVLAHELAHWHRRDPWANGLAWLLCSVHWFNPLLWWALRSMRAEQELAVDARVLQTHGPQIRAVYANALVKAQALRPLGDLSPALACAWQAEHPLLERVQMLKQHDLPVWRRRAALALALGLSVCGAGAVHALRDTSAPAAPPVQAGYSLVQIDADVQIDGIKRRSVRITQNRGSWTWVPVRVPSDDWSGEWMVKVESQALDGNQFRLALVVLRGDNAAPLGFESDGFKGPARVVARPVLVVEAGKTARLEIGDESKQALFAMDLKPNWVQADSRMVLNPVVDR